MLSEPKLLKLSQMKITKFHFNLVSNLRFGKEYHDILCSVDLQLAQND